MEADFEILVADSLDALDRGEAVEAILGRFPAHAADLAPILATAALLTDADLAPSPLAQADARSRFLAAASDVQPVASDLRPARSAAPASSTESSAGDSGPLSWLSRLAWPRPAFAGLAATVLLASTAAVYGSGGALPGDVLYPVKQAIESTRLGLAPDQAARERLADGFNVRRIGEVNALLAAGREAEVGYTGIAEPAGEGRWAIGDVVAEVDSDTRILGHLGEGELIHIIGRTAGGRVQATTIICLDDLPGWEPGEAVEVP